MAYFFPLALVVIGLIHFHAFRTLQALFLPLLTALLSVLWAVGLMGLVGVSLDPFNMTTPILILAVAAGSRRAGPQALLRGVRARRRRPQAIVRSLARVGPVMVAAGTRRRALLLLARDLPDGDRSAPSASSPRFGIVSALVIELTIIPAVRACLPAPRGRECEREAAAHPLLDRFLAVAALGRRRAAALAWSSAADRAPPGRPACGVPPRASRVDTSLKREFSPQRSASASTTRRSTRTSPAPTR